MKVAIVIVCCFAAAFGALPGGKSPLTPEDVKSTEFRGALNMATLEMNRVSNHPRFHGVFNFIEGTKQVVAGILYEFGVVLRATQCENIEANNLENLEKCTPVHLLGASEFHCTFRVLYQAWIPEAKYRVVSPPRCIQPRPAPAAFAGQKTPLTPEEAKSPIFKEAIATTNVHFNQNSQLSNLHSLVRFDRATKQVVAGILYEFEGLFAETVCENTPENHRKSIDQCALGNSARTFVCQYKVLFQAWAATKYTVVDKPACKVRM